MSYLEIYYIYMYLFSYEILKLITNKLQINMEII